MVTTDKTIAARFVSDATFGLNIGLLRRCAVAWLLCGIGLAAVPAKAQDVHNPDILFDISDDEMAAPIGAIADVAVSASIVFLLDRQAFQVRRITLSGTVLEPMGQFGEGPGDLSTPERLALLSDGRCIVFRRSRTGLFALGPMAVHARWSTCLLSKMDMPV